MIPVSGCGQCSWRKRGGPRRYHPGPPWAWFPEDQRPGYPHSVSCRPCTKPLTSGFEDVAAPKSDPSSWASPAVSCPNVWQPPWAAAGCAMIADPDMITANMVTTILRLTRSASSLFRAAQDRPRLSSRVAERLAFHNTRLRDVEGHQSGDQVALAVSASTVSSVMTAGSLRTVLNGSRMSHRPNAVAPPIPA